LEADDHYCPVVGHILSTVKQTEDGKPLGWGPRGGEYSLIWAI